MSLKILCMLVKVFKFILGIFILMSIQNLINVVYFFYNPFQILKIVFQLEDYYFDFEVIWPNY